MYATVDDLIVRFGEDELIALTDRDRTGEVDRALALSVLEDATSEIDGYLAAINQVGTVPKILAVYCCDIARYRLSGGEALETSVVAQRYAQAISYLEKVAAGKVSIFVPETTPEGTTHQVVVFTTSKKVFGRDQKY